jgi:hypothetical protein
MLYVYGIIRSRSLPDRAGIERQPLRCIEADGLSAVVSEHDTLRLEEDVEWLWEHERVVEALMARGPVLPMRVGSCLPSESIVCTTLRERRDEFDRALDRVKGAVELGVRAASQAADEALPAASSPTGEAGEGTAYLLGRLERERGRREIAARIHPPLAKLARATSTRTNPGNQGVFKAAYLVDEDRVEAFTGCVEQLEDELGDTTIVCTGPWPPYSFAVEEESR